jgi:hypothetical protein
MDAGIATEDNLALAKSKNFKFVAVSRKKTYADDFWKDCEEKKFKLSDKKTHLKVKLARSGDELYLLCHSEAKEAKEKAMLEGRLKKFEDCLKQVKEGLKKKRTHKKYETIMERIGRFKEKYGVGNLYDIEIKHKKGVTTDINFSKNPTGEAKQMRVGEYVIRTNRQDLSEEEISKTYRVLTIIEDSFRSMKSELGIRPKIRSGALRDS